jgi:hypothetical protein
MKHVVPCSLVSGGQSIRLGRSGEAELRLASGALPLPLLGLGGCFLVLW